MKNISKSCNKVKPSPDLLDWNEYSKKFSGDLVIKELKQLCINGSEKIEKHLIIPINLTNEMALNVCKNLQGAMTFPKALDKYKDQKGNIKICMYRILAIIRRS